MSEKNEMQAEREAFEAWLSGTYPRSYDEADASHLWKHDHVAALAWKKRAALAQQPQSEVKHELTSQIAFLYAQRVYAETKPITMPEAQILLTGSELVRWFAQVSKEFAAAPQAAPVGQGLTDEQAEEIAHRAEVAVGMNRSAWDCVDAKEIVRAILTQAAHRADHSEDARQMVAPTMGDCWQAGYEGKPMPTGAGKQEESAYRLGESMASRAAPSASKEGA